MLMFLFSAASTLVSTVYIYRLKKRCASYEKNIEILHQCVLVEQDALRKVLHRHTRSNEDRAQDKTNDERVISCLKAEVDALRAALAKRRSVALQVKKITRKKRRAV